MRARLELNFLYFSPTGGFFFFFCAEVYSAFVGEIGMGAGYALRGEYILT